MVIDKFDLELLVATNEDLETYVATVLSQVERTSSTKKIPFELLTTLVAIEWLSNKSINQIALVIVSKETKETLERWVFDLQCLDPETRSAFTSNFIYHSDP